LLSQGPEFVRRRVAQIVVLFCFALAVASLSVACLQEMDPFGTPHLDGGSRGGDGAAGEDPTGDAGVGGDGSPDAFDAAPDAGPDAAPDAAPDAGSDAAPDAAPDAGHGHKPPCKPKKSCLPG
jgi:hypothetical protein